VVVGGASASGVATEFDIGQQWFKKHVRYIAVSNEATFGALGFLARLGAGSGGVAFRAAQLAAIIVVVVGRRRRRRLQRLLCRFGRRLGCRSLHIKQS
jgi:hypothetical protein